MDLDSPIRLDRMFVRDTAAAYAVLDVDAPPRPVVMPDGVPGWLVTRHAEARALLDDRRLGKSLALYPKVMSRHVSPLSDHLLNSDPPVHTRLRRFVTAAFTGPAIARLRPRIEQITASLLADLAAAEGVVDLVETFAFPLPIAVISELLGVAPGHRDRVRAWSRAFTSGAPREVVVECSDEADACLRELIAAKRAQPSRDLLSDLVHARVDGQPLTDYELVAMAFLLLIAGHETTVNLIGNGMLTLLRNPAQLAELRADPGLLPAAIEEFLRYEGPVHIATVRYTTEPVPVGEVEIPAGQFVMISLLAANRDASRYAEPNRFDIARSPSGHLAFGHGIHYCVGAPLARLEARIAFGGLLRRFTSIELAADPAELTWRGSQLMHGLHALPVRVS